MVGSDNTQVCAEGVEAVDVPPASGAAPPEEGPAEAAAAPCKQEDPGLPPLGQTPVFAEQKGLRESLPETVAAATAPVEAAAPNDQKRIWRSRHNKCMEETDADPAWYQHKR